MRALPLLLNAVDACLTTFSEASESRALSQSKNTMKDGGAVEGGGGGGAEPTGGADLCWPFTNAMVFGLFTPTFTPLVHTVAVVGPTDPPFRAARHCLAVFCAPPPMP